MEKKYTDNIVLEGAHIWRKNFSGLEEEYNTAGNRYFLVDIAPDLAEKLLADGWNVRTLQPRDGETEPRSFLKVSVMFGKIPPKVAIIDGNTMKVKTVLNADTVGALDHVSFENVDLIIRPYNWEVGTKTGIKAYLKEMYVIIAENKFERKYGSEPIAVSTTEEASLSVDTDELPF